MKYLACLFLIVGCGVFTGAPRVNAEGYGGSDELRASLRKAQAGVAMALETQHANRLCELPSENRIDPFFRNMLGPGFDSQRSEEILGFIAEKRNDLVELASRIEFTISDEPVIVGSFEVDAKTELSTDGPITFSRSRIAEYSGPHLIALWVHELSHKVKHAGSHITDHGPMGSFRDGSRFLDTVGACVATVLMSQRAE